MIDKKIVESKLETLNANKLQVAEKIRPAQETIKQSNADLNALQGAIQLCEQLLSENVEAEKKDDKN